MIRPFVLLVLLASGVLTGARSAAQAVLEDHPFVPGEVILKFTDDASQGDMEQIIAALGGGRVKGLGRARVELHRLGTLGVEDAVRRYGHNPKIEYIEPNYILKALGVPDDPLFPHLHALRNTGQLGGTPDADIHAAPAWDVSTGSSDVVIGVIDTGVDHLHPDLAANMWTNPSEHPGNGLDDDGNGFVDDVHGYDFYNDDGDPMDDNGHGTHVAGTIGAVGNNGLGVVGVNWNVRIMALKFLSETGIGTTADAIEAINYAVMMGARITNNSWGGGGFSQALLDAIDAADAAGVLFVASAGGGATDNDVYPEYPSSYPSENIVAVAATDADDNLAGFSAYGATSVDLAAPGADILSTYPGNTYRFNSGTSMATAHVSGALGLVLARVPTIGHLEAKSRILENVDVKAGLLGKCLTGGRLNAFLSVAESADIQVEPSTMNLGSGGNWVTVYAELPEAYDPTDVVLETVVLDGRVPVQIPRCHLEDRNQNGIPDWTFKFDRQSVEDLLPEGDDIRVTVGGEIRDTAWFQGADLIRVIGPQPTGSNDGDALGVTRAFVGVDSAPSAAYRLRPSIPNPFQSSARVGFDIPEAAPVRIRVFDFRGRLVRTLVEGAYPAGQHQVTWDGHDENGRKLASGVYFCRLEAGAHVSTIRVALISW